MSPNLAYRVNLSKRSKLVRVTEIRASIYLGLVFKHYSKGFICTNLIL